MTLTMSCSSRLVLLSLLSSLLSTTAAFTTCSHGAFRSVPLYSSSNNDGGNSKVADLTKEASKYQEMAKKLRDELESSQGPSSTSSSSSSSVVQEQQPLEQVEGYSKWSCVVDERYRNANTPTYGYRLYADIGREDGTWMDPRWGASGNRIEFSLDVIFTNTLPIAEDAATITEAMVRDNLSGKSSATRVLSVASMARLRNGFDQMDCAPLGGYRIDAQTNGSGTARFYVRVNGTPERGEYGDIFVPEGCLYFSLPCFGSSVSQLSRKEGIVSVRQMGWHTGWRREESRILGTFRAIPIDDARQKDGY